MSDLIRREDVEEALQGLHVGDARFFEKLRKALDEIPSAEPERKKEKWMYKPNEYDGNTYECSRCGEPWTLIEGTPKENNMNYCPNCGAKLDWSE